MKTEKRERQMLSLCDLCIKSEAVNGIICVRAFAACGYAQCNQDGGGLHDSE